MKKLIIYCIVLCAMVLHYEIESVQQHGQEIFLQANQAYQEGAYEKALELYQSIHHKGVAVWYNMGNCYYMLHNYPYALAYWKKAERLYPAGMITQLRKNMRNAQKHLGLVPTETLLSKVYAHIFYGYSWFFWQLCFLIALFVVAWLAPSALQVKNMKKIALLSLPVIFFALGLILKQNVYAHNVGIIKDETKVYVGPNTAFSSHGSIKKGQEVDIVCYEHDWIKIKLDTMTGWIPYNDIITIH